MNGTFIVLAALVGCLLSGCDGCGPLRGAVPLGTLRQSSCSRDTNSPPAIEATAKTGRISAIVRQASFRCDQAAHALIRRAGKDLNVLVEPLDMDPKSIPKCNCHYDLEFAIDGLSRGTYVLSVFYRGDHPSGADSPVRLGSVSVTVP